MRAPGLGVPSFRRQNRLDDVAHDLDGPNERSLGQNWRCHLGGNQESNGSVPAKNRDRLPGPLHFIEDRLPQVGCANGSHDSTLESP